MRAPARCAGRIQPIPQKGEFGSDTWQDGSNEYAGKVTVWTIMSADEELGLLYLPTNTTAPDFYGAHRLGNNLFAESVVALDINTGKRVWHFQTVHHGLWDYDNPAAPNLLDITVNGTRVKALAQITKQGYVYTFDRATGKPIWPIDEKPVPPSDVPGEKASPTQPIPSKPAPFEYQGVTVERPRRLHAGDSRDGGEGDPGIQDRPAVHAAVDRRHAGAARARPAARTGRAPPSIRRPACCTCRRATRIAVSKLSPPDQALDSNLLYMQTPGRNPQMPEGLPLFKPPYSRMTAIDMNTGNHAWMVPTGAGDRIRNNPRLKPLNLPPVGGDITLSGPLLTKTLLIYALTTGGSTGGAAAGGVRQGDRQGTGVDRSARRGDRHADDLFARRQAIHRDHRAGPDADGYSGIGRAGAAVTQPRGTKARRLFRKTVSK